ncbi:MAG: transcription-repair coupling factor, partial [Blastocatellia bacterium]
GILDIFPAGEAQPVRLEFVGDTIESMRRYDPATQRSVETVDRITVVPLQDILAWLKPPATKESASDALSTAFARHDFTAADSSRLGQGFNAADLDRSATILDYMKLGADSQVIVSEPDEVDGNAMKLVEQLQQSYEEALHRKQRPLPPAELFANWGDLATHLDQATRLTTLGVDDGGESEDGSPSFSTGTHIRCQPAVPIHGRVPDWVAEIRKLRDAGDTTVFVAATPGRAERTIEILKEYDVLAVPVERAEDARYASVLVATGALSHGFRLPAAALQIYAEADVFEEERRAPERRAATKAFLSDLRDLKVGDLVVHVDHGIGVFVGLKQIGVSADAVQEFLELRYAGEDKLFVPVERLDLVQKYTGAARPPLDRLGGASWERAKSKVKKAMRDMAEELLKLYAARRAVPGHAFSLDSHWQQEFEEAFAYELTPDQKSAVADIKRDMESPTPMDRLLCGDVGYGKTEVAMRAGFKAVMDGKQVAFLAPTTVLAFQHQKTLTERFAAFPVRIEMVSRFRSKSEQKEVLSDLAAGKVEIIVGTHRLLSRDVEFRDLGLLVVDEEQRFGVAHKEKIKQLRKKVDVLTMSATPIPRTLNMSLVGIRDMSIIETPPKDRLSIQTNVVKFDQQVIGRAIRNELARGGQVYVVHNRVESIFSIGALIQRLVPDARVVIGHGQMGEAELERAMLDFIGRKYDVLVATTIVENGLDIPNANTIIINRADRYGLAQLYQLRGRVGRSDRPAYAYLLIPPEDNLSPVAKKRLAAIKEFSDLGSGFRVAALDLEIRGAGNLLGGEQSGHIDTVGFEMYMKLLEQTVRELKGEEIEDDVRATVNLRVDLRIDSAYVPDMNQRLMFYRKVAAARRDQEIDRVLEEATDRYGPLPHSVLNLADYGRIRVMADQLGIESIDREGRAVVLKFRPQAKVDPVRLVSLVRQRPDLTLVPPAALKLALDKVDKPDKIGTMSGSEPRTKAAAAAKRGIGRNAAVAPSWWTARAREGEVKPGFSKAEILKPAEDDPRAPGGTFERVGGLLADLLDRM